MIPVPPPPTLMAIVARAPRRALGEARAAKFSDSVVPDDLTVHDRPANLDTVRSAYWRGGDPAAHRALFALAMHRVARHPIHTAEAAECIGQWVSRTVAKDALIVREAILAGHMDEPTPPVVTSEEARARLLATVDEILDAYEEDLDDDPPSTPRLPTLTGLLTPPDLAHAKAPPPRREGGGASRRLHGLRAAGRPSPGHYLPPHLRFRVI
ncbi:hypothetical protein ABEG17_02395 [Pedococcus sp. KACC 23699]|uniref:DUF222 domain-containing protein n=1 Tax=Pedococcus sp. KACC 23699 TaxID=3149228 RepID=A0AAU7JVK3_9MICO